MATLLTTAEIREHVETDLGDDALERVVAAADAEIIRRLGPVANAVEVLRGGRLFLHLPRRASAIVSAVERYAAYGLAAADYALVADDYKLHADGYRVERLADGTNPSSAWNGLVTITFTPLNTGDTTERKLLLANLVKLELEYSGLASDAIGDSRKQYHADHAAAKAALFAPFSAGRRLIT